MPASSGRAFFADEERLPSELVARAPNSTIEFPRIDDTAVAEAVNDFVEQMPAELRPLRDKERLDSRLALVAGLTTMGYSSEEISKVCGITVRQVEVSRAALRRNRTLRESMVESLERIDDTAIPLAVDSAIEHLRNKDKEMTIEMLKGRGLLRTYVNNKNSNEGAAPGRSFTVNILNAPTPALPADAAPRETPLLGIGVPRTIDGESRPTEDE